jgi:hypothetical protein
MGLSAIRMKTLAPFFLIPVLAAAAITPAELDNLVSAARALPPEFTADALIRASAIGTLDRDRRVALLDEAFRTAGQAEQRYKVRSAMTGLPAPVAFQIKVNQQDLDGLDLQARAVAAMLPLDAAKARKLLQSIPALQPAPRKCDDYTVYDLDGFYQVLGAAAGSFADAEKEAGEPARFLRPYTAVTSGVQVGPMAAVLTASGVSDDDFASLLSAFASALGKIQGDDRSFTSSYTAGPRIEALVAECKRRKVSPLPLLEGYRLYLVVNLSAARCADNDRMQAGLLLASNAEAMAANEAIDVAEYFNRKLRVDPLQPIQEGEATPSHLGGAATGLRVCVDEDCVAVSEQLRSLVLTSGGAPVPPGDRESKDWRNRQRDLLEKMSKWEAGQRTTAAEHFREKVLLYNDLVNVSPAGEARVAVLREELDYLTKNRKDAASRVEWFLPVNILLARTALDPHGFATLRAEMQKSVDPVVALYARLEELAPRTPERLTPLL